MVNDVPKGWTDVVMLGHIVDHVPKGWGELPVYERKNILELIRTLSEKKYGDALLATIGRVN